MVRKNKQSGQIALIALLVMTVATTVGLSLISRSTTDVTVTRNIEESTRAFSAAEAGVEEALKSGVASDITIDPALSVKYHVTYTPLSGSSDAPYIVPQKTLKEDTETVWLVNHTGGILDESQKGYTDGTIGICWSSESPKAAIVVSILYHKNGGSYQVAKAIFDPDSRISNVLPTTSSGCTANTDYSGTITFADLGIAPASDTLIALRIRPVFNGAQIAVKPVTSIPVQGNNITSTGTAGGDVNRKIVVYQQFRAPASIFDYAVYSEGNGGAGGNFSQ